MREAILREYGSSLLATLAQSNDPRFVEMRAVLAQTGKRRKAREDYTNSKHLFEKIGVDGTKSIIALVSDDKSRKEFVEFLWTFLGASENELVVVCAVARGASGFTDEDYTERGAKLIAYLEDHDDAALTEGLCSLNYDELRTLLDLLTRFEEVASPTGMTETITELEHYWNLYKTTDSYRKLSSEKKAPKTPPKKPVREEKEEPVKPKKPRGRPRKEKPHEEHVKPEPEEIEVVYPWEAETEEEETRKEALTMPIPGVGVASVPHMTGRTVYPLSTADYICAFLRERGYGRR